MPHNKNVHARHHEHGNKAACNLYQEMLNWNYIKLYLTTADIVSDHTCVSSNPFTRNLPWPFWHRLLLWTRLLLSGLGWFISWESFTRGFRQQNENVGAHEWAIAPFTTLFSVITQFTGTNHACRLAFEGALGVDRNGVTIGALLQLTMDDLSQAMNDARVIDGDHGHYRT
eukprot:3840874-Amphidinium_carterae.2